MSSPSQTSPQPPTLPHNHPFGTTPPFFSVSNSFSLDSPKHVSSKSYSVSDSEIIYFIGYTRNNVFTLKQKMVKKDLDEAVVDYYISLETKSILIIHLATSDGIFNYEIFRKPNPKKKGEAIINVKKLSS